MLDEKTAEQLDEKISLKKEAEDLINDIFEFKNKYAKDLTLIETIIEYSYKKEIPIQHVGETLSEHEDFMKILTSRFEKEGYIINHKNQEKGIDENEW